MKQLIYWLAIISLPLTSCSQEDPYKENQSAERISIGLRDTLYSKALNEEREIWMHVPRSSLDGRKFPVLVLLDGEFNFEAVVGIMKSNVNATLIPEMIIVGIPNTNRYRDLTTSHIGDSNDPSGGADQFLKFIESELIPYVDQKYPTIDYRTLFGHSLGGLFVVNTLLNHSHLFDNYLAIDPSLSMGNQKPLDQARETIKDSKFENKSLYIAAANTLNGEMDYQTALEDTSTRSLHLRAIVEFSELAESNKDLVTKWKYYDDESHGSVPTIAEHHAFRFLFSWFEFKHWSEFFAAEPTLTGDELVQLIMSHHEGISDEMGHPSYPREYEVNRLAYMYLDQKDYGRAFPFFNLNLKLYPNSANAYDSMAEYYRSVSETGKAIEHYARSLELGGVSGTKERLEELKKRK